MAYNNKEYYQKNKERIKANQKKYQQEHKEQIKEYNKIYRQENKERLEEVQAKWYSKNEEKYKKYKREYYKKWIVKPGNKQKATELVREWYARNKDKAHAGMMNWRENNIDWYRTYQAFYHFFYVRGIRMGECTPEERDEYCEIYFGGNRQCWKKNREEKTDA